MAKKKARPEIWNIFFKTGVRLRDVGSGMGITEEGAIQDFLSNNPEWQRRGLEARPANLRSKLFSRHAPIKKFEPRDLPYSGDPDWPAERANARSTSGQIRFA